MVKNKETLFFMKVMNIVLIYHTHLFTVYKVLIIGITKEKTLSLSLTSDGTHGGESQEPLII